MYGYNNSSTCNSYNYSSSSNDLSYPYDGDFLGHSQAPPLNLESFMIPNNEYDSLSAALMMKQELCNYTTSSGGCSSYGSPTSLTSYEAQPFNDLMMQRSVSSHSFYNNMSGIQYHHQLAKFPGLEDSSPVRKAFSTGDLERINMVQQHHRSDSSLSNESSIIECMNAKACKYSPEEKREKIEKYRSKRNQRNFNKKIKYVCRKTLADSRPRIRGRFAKNSDESEKGGQMISEWHHSAAYNHGDPEDDENWINFLDAVSANLIP
ncbi:two-component response regulator-like APRR1 [Apium graveolens]|uniref:two-component response regulator-like APRR1 n=1 Tax=Apium graveolens TaxID=4045 RepID=UPI003D79FB11